MPKLVKSPRNENGGAPLKITQNVAVKAPQLPTSPEEIQKEEEEILQEKPQQEEEVQEEGVQEEEVQGAEVQEAEVQEEGGQEGDVDEAPEEVEPVETEEEEKEGNGEEQGEGEQQEGEGEGEGEEDDEDFVITTPVMEVMQVSTVQVSRVTTDLVEGEEETVAPEIRSMNTLSPPPSREDLLKSSARSSSNLTDSTEDNSLDTQRSSSISEVREGDQLVTEAVASVTMPSYAVYNSSGKTIPLYLIEVTTNLRTIICKRTYMQFQRMDQDVTSEKN